MSTGVAERYVGDDLRRVELRPTRRAVLGGLVAVAGAFALTDAQSGCTLTLALRKVLNF